MTQPVADRPHTFADNVVAYTKPSPVALYRHFDAHGLLLYAGITSDPQRRWQQHLETSLWARYVAYSHVQWVGGRDEARRLERGAIRAEEPIFNTAEVRLGRVATDRKVRYLQGLPLDVLRRVPCEYVAGEFCITCGPDAERYLEEVHAC